MLYYTGVGSRSPELSCIPVIEMLASRLEARGFILRSGHAVGSDQAFEAGVKNLSNSEIYLPGSLRSGEQEHAGMIFPDELGDRWLDAVEIAKKLHPYWEAPGMLSYNHYGQRAHTRNVFQVLGKDLRTPSDLLICTALWDEYGKSVRGGTATAVRLAKQYDIPVFNLIDGQEAIDGITKLVLDLTATPEDFCKCGERRDADYHQEFPIEAYDCPQFSLSDVLDRHKFEGPSKVVGTAQHK
jgi:hypothetical protein